MKRTNKKGFTIAELLIVVAIIAVLVAIAIPVFGTLLERSREATDAANIRNSYAEAVAKMMGGSGTEPFSGGKYKAQQTKANWQNPPDLNGALKDFNNNSGCPVSPAEFYVQVSTDDSGNVKAELKK